MEYLFRLADGRRLALWNERNQIVRLVSGAGQSQSVIRTDFLADLSAVMYEEKIYFVYQNVAGAVMFHAPDGEDVLLFAERLENCRIGGLTLTVWQGRLFLLYTAWNSVRERYAIKLHELLIGEAEVQAGIMERSPGGEKALCEIELPSREEKAPNFRVWSVDKELMIGLDGECFRLNMDEAGKVTLGKGSWMTERECELQKVRTEALKRELEELKDRLANEQSRLDSAIRQYNELAELTRKLQQEGKNWRDRYYQETKKRGNRSKSVKVKRVGESPQ